MDEYDPLFYKLPQDQVQRVMFDQVADIDATFLGFTDIYEALSAIIPKHWVVVDLGCSYAAQAFFFEEHKAYIGVDFAGRERFSARNTMHIGMSIEDFCLYHADGFDLSTTFAICSYVPPWGADNIEIARRSFKNVFTYYPAGTPRVVVRDAGRAALERSEG